MLFYIHLCGLYLRIVLFFSFRLMAEGDWCGVSLFRRSPRHSTHNYTHVLLVPIHHSAYTYPRHHLCSSRRKQFATNPWQVTLCVKVLIYYTATSFKHVLKISYTCNSLYQGLLPLQMSFVNCSFYALVYSYLFFQWTEKKKPRFVIYLDLLQFYCFIYINAKYILSPIFKCKK